MTMNDRLATPVPTSRDAHAGRTVRFYNVRLSERDAWLGATMAVLFNALGMLLEFAIVRKNPGVSSGPVAASAFVALMLLIVLFIRRKTPSARWACVIYLVNTAAVVTMLLSTNLQFAISNPNWQP